MTGQEISHDNSLILNGSNVNKLRYLNDSYRVLNTCAFDSIIVGIAVACNDYNTYRMKINRKNEFLNLANKLVLNLSKDELYVSRFLLLLLHFEIQLYIPVEKYINAECNVTKIMNSYLKTDPSCIQITKCTKKCVGKQFKSLPTIILKDKNFTSFTQLNIMLDKYLSVKSKHCNTYNCKGIRVLNRLLEDHIFIETEMFSNGIYNHKLSDFPETITVTSKK